MLLQEKSAVIYGGGGAIGGAVAVAGVAVGVYYGTRVDETPMGFIVLPPRMQGANPQ